MKKVIVVDEKSGLWREVNCEDELMNDACEWLKEKLSWEIAYKELFEKDMEKNTGVLFGERRNFANERKKELKGYYFDLDEETDIDEDFDLSESISIV